MSVRRPLDYKGLLLFLGWHLTDSELLDAEAELHQMNLGRAGVLGPRAPLPPLDPPLSAADAGKLLECILGAEFARRATCLTCHGKGLWPELCPDCQREAAQ